MVLLSETFFAVISFGLVVQFSPSTLYSTLTAPPLLSVASAVPAACGSPSYLYVASSVFSVMLLMSLDFVTFSLPTSVVMS